jgi:thermitase
MVYEYRFLGRTIALEPDDEFVAVRFNDQVASNMRGQVAYSAGISDYENKIELPGEKYTLIPIGAYAGAMLAGSTVDKAKSALFDTERVVNVVPVFKIGQDKVVATDRVLAEIVGDASAAFSFLEESGCEIIDRRNDEYTIRIPDSGDAFDVANQLSERKGVRYAEPDFITLSRRPENDLTNEEDASGAGQVQIASYLKGSIDALSGLRSDAAYLQTSIHEDRVGEEEMHFLAGGMDASLPAAGPALSMPDPLLAQQYAAQITKAIDAWRIQVGSSEIKIAILDDGVDLEHEDLRASIVGSYDGILDSSPLQSIPWEKHGTACAGIAAAVPNNGIGICGISNGCSLLAVRIGQPLDPHGPYWKTDSYIIARSIDWAWEHGADVLSNSWGSAPSNRIYHAIERARTRGRNGKGSVIVVAAGNASSPSVGFPASLPEVLVVSASNQYDEFKTKTSSDNENGWGSNYGAEIGVSAPGVLNMTTDISGVAGYAPGNYYAKFNGTSSACPMVAGAAALVISANPALTEADVRDIIQQTADKVEGHRYPYVGGRNDQHGFGRLNVLCAVQRAKGGGCP